MQGTINIKLEVTNSNENKPNQNFDKIIEIKKTHAEMHLKQ